MSLARLDRKGWAEKKSTRRLKVILKKCRENYVKLHGISITLHQYNLPVEEVLTLYHSYVLKAATLDNIIKRRRNEK